MDASTNPNLFDVHAAFCQVCPGGTHEITLSDGPTGFRVILNWRIRVGHKKWAGGTEITEHELMFSRDSRELGMRAAGKIRSLFERDFSAVRDPATVGFSDTP